MYARGRRRSAGPRKEITLRGKIAESNLRPLVGVHRLRLYVAGSSPRSLRAVENLTRVCETELAGRYKLEIVDIYKEPHRATEDQIVAIPTLVKQAPGLVSRMIGDLSEESQVRRGLGLF